MPIHQIISKPGETMSAAAPETERIEALENRVSMHSERLGAVEAEQAKMKAADETFSAKLDAIEERIKGGNLQDAPPIVRRIAGLVPAWLRPAVPWIAAAGYVGKHYAEARGWLPPGVLP